ncbi:hypothetical protein DITRI_Ditri11bG0032900 [Diplodiscus trichospermus]
MGKKVNQLASTKMSKNEKQLHSLIKVLRPKVYITDSSSFKQLVQELTGYRSQTTDKVPGETEKVVPVIEIEDQGEIIPAATAAALSMDSSFYSFESTDHQAFELVEKYELTGMMLTADDDMSMFDQMNPSSINQQSDWLAYQNLESWLLDAEPYYTQHEQAVNLFDYELSGLI